MWLDLDWIYNPKNVLSYKLDIGQNNNETVKPIIKYAYNE